MFTRHLGKFSNYEAVKAALEAGTLAEPYVALDVSSNVSSLVLPEGDNPVYINYRRDVPVKLAGNITLQGYYCANSPYLNAKVNIPLVFDYIDDYVPSVRVIDKAWFIQRMEEDNLTEEQLIALCFSNNDTYRQNEYNYKSPVPENFIFERPVTWLSGKGYDNSGSTQSCGDDLPVPSENRALEPLGGYATERQGYYIILAALTDPTTGYAVQGMTYKLGEYRMAAYLTPDASIVATGMQTSLRSYWWDDNNPGYLASWYAVPQNTVYNKAKFVMYWAEDFSTPEAGMSGSTGAIIEYDVTPTTNFYFSNDGWNLTNSGSTDLHAMMAIQLYNSVTGATSAVFGYEGPVVEGQATPPVPDASGTHVYQIYNVMQHNNNGFYDTSVYLDSSTKVVFYGNVLDDGALTHGIKENGSEVIGDAHPGYYGSQFRIFSAGSTYYHDRGSEQNNYRIQGGSNDGGMHTCEYGNFYISIDGNQVAQMTPIENSNDQATYSRYPIAIFGAYADGTPTCADGDVSVGYFKIYEGETIVRDYVPAVNDSSIVGLLDKVNYKFYANQAQGQGVVADHLGFISVTTDASGNVTDTSTDIVVPWWEEVDFSRVENIIEPSGNFYDDLETSVNDIQPGILGAIGNSGDVVLIINGTYENGYISGGRAVIGTVEAGVGDYEGNDYLEFADCSIGDEDTVYILGRYEDREDTVYFLSGQATSTSRVDTVLINSDGSLDSIYGPSTPLNNPATAWYENVDFSNPSSCNDSCQIVYESGVSVQNQIEHGAVDLINLFDYASNSAGALVVNGEYDSAGHLTGGRRIPGVIDDVNSTITFTDVYASEYDSLTLVIDMAAVDDATPVDASAEIVYHNYKLIRQDEVGAFIGIKYQITQSVDSQTGDTSYAVSYVTTAPGVNTWTGLNVDDSGAQTMFSHTIGISEDEIDSNYFAGGETYLQFVHYYENELEEAQDSSTFIFNEFLTEHSELIPIDASEDVDLNSTPYVYDSSTDEIPVHCYSRVCDCDVEYDSNDNISGIATLYEATNWQDLGTFPDIAMNYQPTINSDSSTLSVVITPNEGAQQFGYTYARYGVYTSTEYDASVNSGDMSEMEFFEAKMTSGPIDISTGYTATVNLVEGQQEFIAELYNPTTQEYWPSNLCRHGVTFPEPLSLSATYDDQNEKYDLTVNLSPALVNDGYGYKWGSYNKTAWDNDVDGIQGNYDYDLHLYLSESYNSSDASTTTQEVWVDTTMEGQLAIYALPVTEDGQGDDDWDNYHELVFDINV